MRGAGPRHGPAHTLSSLTGSLTNVGRDDGEGAQVGVPHVLGQGAGIGLIVLQQPGGAALRLLDQLPVPLVGRIQEGAAHAQQILGWARSQQAVPTAHSLSPPCPAC